jgi:uncharacterized membrane protein
MEVNAAAPAIARGEIEVAAPVETVWRVLTEVAKWPTWNSDVKSAVVDGSLSAGTTFRWKAGPGTITSTVGSTDPPRRIDWTGTTVGIKAIHVHELEQREANTGLDRPGQDGVLVRVQTSS